MKLTRCPICHNEINLEALVEDDSGRELLILVSNSRAVNLINEVLKLYQPSRHLAHALRETVNNIHAKRALGEYKPFKNHNYLKSVYESTKHLFAYVEHKEEDKPARSSNEEYFEQMYRAGVDFSKLEKNIPGALDWYKNKTGA